MKSLLLLGTWAPQFITIARRGIGLLALSCLAATALHAKLTVKWTDNSWDETAFEIERSDDGNPFAYLATVGADVVAYEDSSVPDGTSTVYEYRVRAKNSAGYSAYSNVVTNAVAITAHPAATINASAHTNVSISVVATGIPAPTYQWQRGGVNLANDGHFSGVNGATLLISDIMPELSGTYAVVVSGVGPQLTSNASTVTVPKIVPVLTWATPEQIDDDVPISNTQLNASANVAGTFTYDPVAGTKLAVGTHTLTANFIPTDTTNYTNASTTVSLQVVNLVPTRPTLFDHATYLVLNPDVAATIGNVPDKADKAWTHYYEVGVFEGRTDGDFNVNAYLVQYPNLAAIYGSDLRGAAMHWYTIGRPLGLRVPNGFDITGYFARNQDLAAYFANDKYGAWIHYYNYGVYEGRTFDANFIAAEYLELNLDLKDALGSNLQGALMHWLTWGHPVEDRMGRVPTGFYIDTYLSRYPDLAAAFAGVTPLAVRNVAIWNHFVIYGCVEGRSDGDFDAYSYLAGNPDLAAVFGTDPTGIRGATLHWYFYGRREGRRIPYGFNVQNYRSLYPDLVVFAGDDLYGCWLHYRDTGVNEGRIYDNLFRVDEYLFLNPDVAAAVNNDRTDALLHWLYFGQFEGRPGRF